MPLVIKLLWSARWLLVTALVASVAGGFGGTAQVALVHSALNHGPDGLGVVALQFGAVSVFVLAARWISQVQFVRASQALLARLRRDISHGIAGTEYRQLEGSGSAPLMAVLTDDVSAVAEWVASLPRLIVNAAIVLGCLAYLAILSWPLFVLATGVVGIGSVGYHLSHSRALRYLRDARAKEDDLFRHFRSLFEGAKELRLHMPRRAQFLSELVDGSIDDVRRLQTEGMTINVRLAGAAHFLFFMLIGAVVFGFSALFGIPRDALTGYALVLLYMMLPLESMLGFLPGMGRAQVALERIEGIMPRLLAPAQGEASASRLTAYGEAFQSLRFIKAYWRYTDRADEGFILGPLDFELCAGEVVFLVGSNGGGKTTLAKLLVGLYAPQDGEVYVNEQRVSSTTAEAYRGLFSAVFSDFFLFDRLLGLAQGDPSRDADLDGRAAVLLEQLRLSSHVGVAGGKLSTTELSAGQRKRLALMVARLEDRPIYVFDEWAADQDPQYREIFYRHILPELKAAGKAVLAITHDDRYFHLADRRVELRYGRLVERRPAEPQEPMHSLNGAQ